MGIFLETLSNSTPSCPMWNFLQEYGILSIEARCTVHSHNWYLTGCSQFLNLFMGQYIDKLASKFSLKPVLEDTAPQIGALLFSWGHHEFTGLLSFASLFLKLSHCDCIPQLQLYLTGWLILIFNSPSFASLFYSWEMSGIALHFSPLME